MSFTNAELAQQVNELINFSASQSIEYANWLGGKFDGGPNLDGKFPLTDWQGSTALVESPAKLVQMVTAEVDSAAAFAAAAQLAETQAGITLDTITTISGNVTSLRDQCAAAQAAAELAQSAAENAATTATTQANSIRYFVSATAPVSPALDDIWFDTTTPTINYWNGSSWVQFT